MAAQDDAPDDEPLEEPSKSQRKRAAAELKELGDELVALPPAELDALPIGEKLRDAIELAHRITAHGGAARQRQLIGKLLRKTDVEDLRAAIGRRVLERRMVARDFHRLESWRDRLLAEGEPAIAALIATEPRIDAHELRALVAAARTEAAAGRGPSAARALFRRLRDWLAAPGPSA
jgi:ribosome-associated protein